MNRLKLLLLVMIVGSYAAYVHQANATLTHQVENLRGLYTTTIQDTTNQIAQIDN